MRGSAWAALLRHIPAAQHDQLMLVTTAGVEIALYTLLRIDHEFVAVRGRLAGSQEAGRVFLIPYANIAYFGYQKEIKEADFEATFSSLVMPAPHGHAAPAAAPAPAPATPAAAPPAPAPDAPAPDAAPAREPAMPAPRVGVPIKSAVLEKFRARTLGPSHPGTLSRPAADG
jgi:hypothetical protein